MPDSFLPDGSLCRADLLQNRYSRHTRDRVLLPPSSWAFGESFGTTTDRRTPTEHDRDRVLYTSHFQRLQGVTQVVSPHSHGSLFHNRLIHSLKVASLAKAIANNQLRAARDDEGLRDSILHWGGLDATACETAGLAHDIGHPPFGHAAESLLDGWLKDGGEDPLAIDGFEGNAQSFRAITNLERREVSSRGLELTTVTLAAVLKYPWLRVEGDPKRGPKFGAIRADVGILDSARGWTEAANLTPLTQSLEASIMDIADDITYAVHDLQDFITAGVIATEKVKNLLYKLHGYVGAMISAEADGREPSAPETDLASFVDKLKKAKKFYPSFFDLKTYRDAVHRAIGTLDGLTPELASSQPMARMRSQSSQLIAELVDSVRIAEPRQQAELGDQPRVYLEPAAWHLVQVLKDVTKAFVVETPRMGLHQEAQLDSLTALLDRLDAWVLKKSPYNLPPRLVAYLARRESEDEQAHRRRAIVDFCCSLTDAEAHIMSLQLRGIEVPSVS